MLNPFQRRDNPHLLVVGMVGVKMGDRLAHVGCAHGGRLGAVAAKVGLSGRAAAFAPDQASGERARKGAANAGVLVEIEVAAPDSLPADDGAFDVVVADDTGGLFTAMGDDARAAAALEMLRILRPGGRIVWIGAGAAGGLAALFGRASRPSVDPLPSLRRSGYRPVRVVGEGEGLTFAEGIKPRT